MDRLTLRDVPGLRVGHWTDAAAATGCTVILADERGAVAGVDVRGSAPGTRETDLLRPTALVERINAVCLAGGSAFGLGAADGVMRRLAERGIGFPTPVRAVPIVPTAILFDLSVGDPDAFPDAEAGYAATLSAERNDGALEGRVGAGAGATVAKLGGLEGAHRAGIGSAAARLPDGAVIGALVANNALGDVLARDGRPLARSAAPDRPVPGNTVLAVVGTDAPLDRAQCRVVAGLVHDAIARCIRPAHTMWDGDVAFVLSSAGGEAATTEMLATVAALVDEVVGEAVERSVTGAGA